jgi:hypothetical protein
MQAPLIPVRAPVRLTTPRRLGLYGVGAVSWTTGALWLVFHYFMVRKTDFGPSPHPFEHWWLSLHGLAAFAALWMFGLMWGAHIAGGWKTGRRRITGSLLLLVLAELIGTGYLLYYPPGEGWVPTLSVLHWAVGLAAPLPFVVHRLWAKTTH